MVSTSAVMPSPALALVALMPSVAQSMDQRCATAGSVT
jgi:hypothetical protein